LSKCSANLRLSGSCLKLSYNAIVERSAFASGELALPLHCLPHDPPTRPPMAVMESAMSLAPDILLQPAAKPKPKARAAPANVPANTPPTSQRKAANFAQMYARERHDKAVERAEPVAKGARERFSQRGADDVSVAGAQVSPEQVAASGKALPVDADTTGDAGAVADDEMAPEPLLDPLMLLALTGQLPADSTPTSAALPVADVGLPTAAELAAQAAVTAGAAGATMTDASHDPALDTLTSAAGVQLLVDLAAKAQLAAQAATQQGATNVAQDFAGTMAGIATQLQPAAEGKLGDAALAALKELGDEGGEALKDASPELRSENLSARLSALTQAIGQPTPAATRVGVLPGQPLALHQGGWSEAVVDKVMWLSSQNLKSAEIQLNPAELGRLEVRVDMAKDQTQVTFASPHAGVRETLEGQMQRLRDLFTEQGMNLLNVNVSDQSLSRGWQGQEQSNGGNGAHRGGGLLAAGDDEHLTAVSELRGANSLSPRGLVDYYA
jgi:flagellar hook-length control protein FliK